MTTIRSIVIDQEVVDWMRSTLVARASFADRTAPINEIRLIPAVKDLYGLLQLTAPKVVVCQSPLQMRLMPLLFLCPKLDQMFALPGNTISEQVRTKLTTLIGSEVTTNLLTTFDNNYKAGEEPGEFLVDKFSALRWESDPTLSDKVAGVVDPECRRQISDRYFEVRDAASRYWVLFDHVRNYLRELPRDVVVPMDETLQERVLLQLTMNLKAPLNSLSGHLTLAQIHSLAGSEISELEHMLVDLVNERMNLQVPLAKPGEPIWSTLGEAHLIYPFKNICFVCQFPSKVVRSDGILHCQDQAAIEYSDGLKLHFWRGMRVPAQLIEQRSSITPAQISDERNIELRRVMIEMMGAENYIEQSGAVPIQEDEFGSLYVLGPRQFGNIMMVRLVNSTPESDGSRRIYWLRVPPTVRTAKEGVAWSFNMEESDYRPIAET